MTGMLAGSTVGVRSVVSGLTAPFHVAMMVLVAIEVVLKPIVELCRAS